jgi:hypothetical protein
MIKVNKVMIIKEEWKQSVGKPSLGDEKIAMLGVFLWPFFMGL